MRLTADGRKSFPTSSKARGIVVADENNLPGMGGLPSHLTVAYFGRCVAAAQVVWRSKRCWEATSDSVLFFEVSPLSPHNAIQVAL